jgi:hypothetical protein
MGTTQGLRGGGAKATKLAKICGYFEKNVSFRQARKIFSTAGIAGACDGR